LHTKCAIPPNTTIRLQGHVAGKTEWVLRPGQNGRQGLREHELPVTLSKPWGSDLFI